MIDKTLEERQRTHGDRETQFPGFVHLLAAQLERVEAEVKVLEGDMLKPFATDDGAEGQG